MKFYARLEPGLQQARCLSLYPTSLLRVPCADVAALASLSSLAEVRAPWYLQWLQDLAAVRPDIVFT